MHTKGSLTRRSFTLAAAVIGMVLLSVGCAISDYRGYLGHMTESEAKLWGSQIGFITGDPNTDGTYEYTVKYDFRGTRTVPTGTYPSPVDIFTYRNPTVGAFSRDGCVDRDGDELQQRPGSFPFRCDLPVASTTKFMPLWEFEDRNAGCQFFTNYEKTYGSPKVTPLAALCIDGPSEEVDKDLSLQGSQQSNTKEAFESLDALIGAIWSGAVGTSFTMNVTSITLNGVEVGLANPAALGVGRNSLRIINTTFDATSPGAQDLVRAILSNTQDGVPATVALGFEGGMRLSQPSLLRIAFDHDELVKLLD